MAAWLMWLPGLGGKPPRPQVWHEPFVGSHITSKLEDRQRFNLEPIARHQLNDEDARLPLDRLADKFSAPVMAAVEDEKIVITQVTATASDDWLSQ